MHVFPFCARVEWACSLHLVRYGYVNGAPFVVEIAAVSGDKQTLSGYTKYYLQANYHGDLVTTVEASNGNGGQRGWFDPW